MVLLCNSCHKIPSSLYENCKDRLLNVTGRIKEKKLWRKVSPLKVNLQINLIRQFYQICYHGPREDKTKQKKKSSKLESRYFCGETLYSKLIKKWLLWVDWYDCSGSCVPPLRWVPSLWSRVPPLGSWVTWVSDPSKRFGSRVPLFGYANVL